MEENEKVITELNNLRVFFSKAATKLTLSETISKAQWLINKIEREIHPGGDSANLALNRYKALLANLIIFQNRCLEVFESASDAERWIKSEVKALGAKRRLG